MKNEILIDLENVNIVGNVLDIGFCNYGIAYSLFKNRADEVSVDYVEGKDATKHIEEDFYDTCIIFFCLSGMGLKSNRKKILLEAIKHLKIGGIVHIWDLDKPRGRIFRGKLKVVLPGNIYKNITITDVNIAKDASFVSTKEIVEKYFEIMEHNNWDKVYCIKGKKIK